MRKYKSILMTVLMACVGFISQAGIHEDWVWEYKSSFMVADPGHVSHYFMKFDGSQKRGDIEYHKFVEYRCEWYDTDSGELIKDMDPDLVYYIREADGVYYVLLKDGEIIRHELSQEDFEKEDVSEIVLYDYNIADGGVWNLPLWWDKTYGGNPAAELKEFRMIREADVKIGDEDCRVFEASTSNFTFVEGVGPLENGHLAEPTMCNISGFVHEDPGYPRIHSFLVSVKDKEGKIVYAPAKAGVGQIIDEADNAPAAVCDLCGRTVLTDAAESDLRSLPKGIYIYKGRKIII